MDIEFSATELAETCGVKVQQIKDLGRQGRIRKVPGANPPMYLLTADELGMLKVSFSNGTKIDSMVFQGEILYLRDACLARKHEVALGAVIQAFAVTQMTELPVVKWDDLLTVMRAIGAAPVDCENTWLSKLIQQATTGKSGFLSVEYQLYREEAAKRQSEAGKKKAKRRSRPPDGMLTVANAASKFGMSKDYLRAMCREGLVQGAIRGGGEKENSPWFVPEKWNPPDEIVQQEIPDGLAEMVVIAKKHGISRDTMRRWCTKGMIDGACRIRMRNGMQWIVPEDWKPPIHWGRGKKTRWAK